MLAYAPNFMLRVLHHVDGAVGRSLSKDCGLYRVWYQNHVERALKCRQFFAPR